LFSLFFRLILDFSFCYLPPAALRLGRECLLVSQLARVEIRADPLLVVLAPCLPHHPPLILPARIVDILAWHRPVQLNEPTGVAVHILLLADPAQLRSALHLLHLGLQLPLGLLLGRLLLQALHRPLILDVAPELSIHHGMVELPHNPTHQRVLSTANAGRRIIAGVAHLVLVFRVTDI